MTTIISLSTLLQSFFTDRLMKQRQASPHTIASFRDTFRLLLEFAYKRLKKPPSKLAFDDLTEPFVGAFLDHIQSDRHNGTRIRNLRLTVNSLLFSLRRVSRAKTIRSHSTCAGYSHQTARPPID